MASNNPLPDPMIFSGQSHIPRRRKHRNSAVAVAFRHRAAPKKHSDNNSNSPVNFCEGLHKSEASARKLAAGLCQFRLMEASEDGGADFQNASSFPLPMSPLANGNVKITLSHHHNTGEKFTEMKDRLRRPLTILRSGNGIQCETESSLPNLKCSKEEAKKWNPTLKNEASDECPMIHSRKCVEDEKIVGDYDSVMTTLLEELLRAQRSIKKLKAAQKASKKRVKQFLQNLEKEKLFWKRRECQRVETMLNDLKDKLERERKSRERMELLNTKLVQELAKANLSAKQFMTKYKKEKKERELIEEVCNELAMQIGEDKAKLEGLSDSMKICEELEEERKMMQMAELWREESVQMKLVEAQCVLEDKYNQMVELIAFLQTFLRSKGAELDTTELEDTQLIKQDIESVNIQRIVELSYDFSKSDNIVSIFEELRKDNIEEGVNKPDSHLTLTSPLPTAHIESLDEEMLNKNSTLHDNSSPSSDYNKNSNGGTTISSTQSSQHKRFGDDRYEQKESTGSIIQNGGITSSQCKSSVEGSFKHSELLGPGNSTCNMNPHILRGMKGCTEWPRGIPKSNSKVIPSERKSEKQKI
ncbi:uncharacterized protein LOC113852181 [Abrus precatorius]|uniref:Uncharacterized protein LOC113852181 n=1 Tax=Abrus precatorius TaxID=3816 RepID=A0A8B8K549_ABRPR|nr:uncharacterized protein LOC113852181 [Abrus precatorius]